EGAEPGDEALRLRLAQVERPGPREGVVAVDEEADPLRRLTGGDLEFRDAEELAHAQRLARWAFTHSAARGRSAGAFTGSKRLVFRSPRGTWMKTMGRPMTSAVTCSNCRTFWPETSFFATRNGSSSRRSSSGARVKMRLLVEMNACCFGSTCSTSCGRPPTRPGAAPTSSAPEGFWRGVTSTVIWRPAVRWMFAMTASTVE